MAGPDHSPCSSDDFRTLFRNHPGGVALVTADDGNGPVAMTVTSLISVSADPPYLVFSASAISSSTPTILAASSVVVHVLSSRDVELGQLGVTSGVDRFADSGAWSRLPTGEPYFHGVNVWARGEIVLRQDMGGGTLVGVKALEMHTGPEEHVPLVYHNREWHALNERTRVER